jgi:hypothetical protein
MLYAGEVVDRKTFFLRLSSLAAVGLVNRRTLAACVRKSVHHPHPEPRPGITAERVLAVDALGPLPYDRVVEAYDAARRYPSIFDGLACACGCSGTKGEHRSLLVCYETKQPTGCVSCQQQAHLARRLAKDGKSLAEIREAFDKEYS